MNQSTNNKTRKYWLKISVCNSHLFTEHLYVLGILWEAHCACEERGEVGVREARSSTVL